MNYKFKFRKFKSQFPGQMGMGLRRFALLTAMGLLRG